MSAVKPAARALNVYLGDLKDPWAAYCAARGVKPGVAIRDAIAQQLKSAPAAPAPGSKRKHEQADEEPDAGQKERIRVWLTPSEKQAVKALADADQSTMSRWIIDALRTRLTHEPQFSTREIEVVGESNYQLLSAGRNLNQIARRLNEGKDAPELAAAIKALRDQITEHVVKVDRAMRASVERWRIE